LGKIVDDVLKAKLTEAEAAWRAGALPTYMEVSFPTPEAFREFTDQLMKEGVVTVYFKSVRLRDEVLKLKPIIYKGEYFLVNFKKKVVLFMPAIRLSAAELSRMKIMHPEVCRVCKRRLAYVYTHGVWMCTVCARMRVEVPEVLFKIKDVPDILCYNCPAYYGGRCWAYEPEPPSIVKSRLARAKYVYMCDFVKEVKK
jgi:hypothetical protein